MICEDHIGGLVLFDQWTDKALQFPEFLIHSVSRPGIVIILCLDCALASGLIAAIADIGGFLHAFAGFPLTSSAIRVPVEKLIEASPPPTPTEKLMLVISCE